MACNGVLSAGTRLVNDWITRLGMAVVDVIVWLVELYGGARFTFLSRFSFQEVG